MKWLWRLCRLAVEAALIGAVSVFTVWYAVTEQLKAVWRELSISPPDVGFDPAKYVSALARQAAPFFSSAERKDAGAMARTDTDAGSADAQLSPKPGGEEAGGEQVGRDEARPVWNAVTPNPAPSVSSIVSSTPSAAVSPLPPSAGANNGAAPATGSSAVGPSPDRPAVAVTERQIFELRNRLSDADKKRVFDLLSARLTTDEIRRIADLFEEGLTEAELKEIDSIVARRLSPAEYAELSRILAIRTDTD